MGGLTLEEKENILTNFNRIGDHAAQNQLLRGLATKVDVKRRRPRAEDGSQRSCSWQLKVTVGGRGDVAVCQKAFIALHGIARGRLASLLSKDELPIVDGRGRHSNRPSAIAKSTLCKKAFTQNNRVQCHTRVHSGEKPYTCEMCKKSFAHSGHLQSRMRIDTGEKPHKCKVREKSFSARSNLQVHLRTHSGEKPYTCGICKKSFIDSAALKHHMRTHTGEKLFTCERCGKSFTRRVHLECHLRTHTGEKPFTSHIVSHQKVKPHHMNGEENACEGFLDLMIFPITATQSSGQEFVCKLCFKSFPSEETFQRHTETSDCEKTCSLSNSNESQHMVEKQSFNTQIHSGGIVCIGHDEYNASSMAPAEETIRDFIFDEKSDNQEKFILTAKLYGCGICDKMFLSDRAFVTHCINHENHVYAEFWYRL